MKEALESTHPWMCRDSAAQALSQSPTCVTCVTFCTDHPVSRAWANKGGAVPVCRHWSILSGGGGPPHRTFSNKLLPACRLKPTLSERFPPKLKPQTTATLLASARLLPKFFLSPHDITYDVKSNTGRVVGDLLRQAYLHTYLADITHAPNSAISSICKQTQQQTPQL